MTTRAAFLTTIVLIATAVAACGVDSATSQQGIEGRYLLHGPGFLADCSEVPPGDERDECEAANEPWTRPMAAEEIEVRNSSNQSVTRIMTDSEGAFRVGLPGGDYLLCSFGCEGPITVRTGEFTYYEMRLVVP